MSSRASASSSSSVPSGGSIEERDVDGDERVAGEVVDALEREVDRREHRLAVGGLPAQAGEALARRVAGQQPDRLAQHRERAPLSSGSTLVRMPPSQRWTVSSPRTRSRVMNVAVPRISAGIAANAG